MPQISYKDGLEYRLAPETVKCLSVTEEEILSHFDREGYEAGLYFTDDAEMSLLNGEYRHKEGPTDVLSFPLKDDNAMNLGEIIISADTAERQSDGDMEREITELFVHGMLHLLGFDHEKDEEYEIMNGYERKFLNRDE